MNMTKTRSIVTKRASVAFLFLSFGAAACGAAPDPSTATADGTPVPVTVGRIGVTTNPSVFEAGGVLVARQTAIISSRVMAPIARITVEAGEHVRRGQVLIALDGDEVNAQADRSRASLESARASTRVVASDRAAAEAAVALARATHGRVARLHAERSATAPVIVLRCCRVWVRAV